ncbi:CPBP family intramembrane glutamic endopeptidase [Gramella sp. KN1008]|uniref:CPBP family intramembrane glutamic endopeptidase n=1 Tax=Gramella sp. KN1008 TaxID=2529298 RepID=UPI00103A59BE|nr:type II CAAX endopeptidase family protein [Gramella sp. KN1008]TBW30027.1 CPBP family intramembrane metalloprotease [Gramella sp. KN1008]
MIGIIIILAVSWLILYVFERRSLLALGFLPVLIRAGQFLMGFLITGLLCAGVQYMEVLISSAEWKINIAAFPMLLEMFWWDFRSVLTEELVFRGAILFVLIRKFGASGALLLSAIAFGVYHWFSFGIFGNFMPMLVIFIGTGLMGYAWALAFYKTESIIMPLGLHLGWNFFYNSIFSNGPLGEGLILTEGGQAISDWYSLIGLLLVPVIVLLIVIYWMPKVQDNSIFSDREVSVPKIQQ